MGSLKFNILSRQFGLVDIRSSRDCSKIFKATTIITKKQAIGTIIAFYGSDFKPYDLPLPRAGTTWALLHEESPKNNPLLCNKRVSHLFNYTAAMSRHSDLPLALHHLRDLDAITSRVHFKPLSEKVRIADEENLAPIIYVQSACDAPSQRDLYVTELQKFFRIDSYGKCLHNRELPKRLQDPTSSMEDPGFLELISKYKYVIAFENAIGEDYITEKLWRPIELGVVPIYLGSPSAEDWLPHDKAAILVSDFSNVESLAKYIFSLDRNETAYNEHLLHKLQQQIQNEKLVEAFQSQKWDLESESFIDGFQCFLCDEAYKIEAARRDRRKYETRADQRVFSCPMPVNPVSKKTDPTSWWNEYFETSLLEADVMCDLVKKDEPYPEEPFREEVIRRLHAIRTADEL